MPKKSREEKSLEKLISSIDRMGKPPVNPKAMVEKAQRDFTAGRISEKEHRRLVTFWSMVR